jgi:hypothetical protein
MAITSSKQCILTICTLYLLQIPALGFSGQDEIEFAEMLETWQIKDYPTEPANLKFNISGITLMHDDLLIVGADELAHIQVLKKESDTIFRLIDDGNIELSDDETELDIEGLASANDMIWVIGSHSMKRKSMKCAEDIEEKAKKEAEKPEDKRKDLTDYNYKRVATVAIEPTREWLYQLKIDEKGRPDQTSIARGSLRDIFANHPILARFQTIPSKENGIDIEGLAIKKIKKKTATVLIGLRGPSLRGPLAVVLETTIKPGESAGTLKISLKETHLLSLGGRGIRGISEIGDKGDDFLILAGPIGDEPSPYTVYRWNGKSTLPEVNNLDDLDNRLTALCQIPLPDAHAQRCSPGAKAKAEGVHFLAKKNEKIEFAIVYDSAAHGAPTKFSCKL